jgi:hypothetical protein
VKTTEGLLGRNNSESNLECREYGRRDPSRSPFSTLYPQKLALTSLTSGGRSVGIVRSRTQATELSLGFRMVKTTIDAREKIERAVCAHNIQKYILQRL